jgi:hypothetical protein
MGYSHHEPDSELVGASSNLPSIHVAGAKPQNARSPPKVLLMYQQEILSDEERSEFAGYERGPSEEDLMQKVMAWDEEHQRVSKARRVLPRVKKILDVANLYLGAIGICIQYSPEISSLVVGGFRCIIDVWSPSWLIQTQADTEF